MKTNNQESSISSINLNSLQKAKFNRRINDVVNAVNESQRLLTQSSSIEKDMQNVKDQEENIEASEGKLTELERTIANKKAEKKLLIIRIERIYYLLRNAFTGLDEKGKSYKIIMRIFILKCWDYFGETSTDLSINWNISKELEVKLSQKFKSFFEEKDGWNWMWAFLRNIFTRQNSKYIFSSPQLSKDYLNGQTEKIEKCIIDTFKEVFEKYHMQIPRDQTSSKMIIRQLKSRNVGQDLGLEDELVPVPTKENIARDQSPEIKISIEQDTHSSGSSEPSSGMQLNP